MKKFKRIKDYNKKYGYELREALKTIRPYLIQAFTIFYGDKYYSKIKETINSICYTFFLSEPCLKVFRKYGYNISNKDKRITSYYIQYLSDVTKRIRLFDEDTFVKASCDAYIVESDFARDSLSELFLDYLDASDKNPFYTVFEGEGEKYYHAIFLPLLAVNLETVIHEVNHAFMDPAVAVSEDDIIMPTPFLNKECVELFNDYIAHQILDIYIKLRAPIPSCLGKFDFVNCYEQFFYLIEPFYIVFHKIIQESIMSENFNMLKEYAGKENFDLFCRLVKAHFENQECSEKELTYLYELVFQMQEHGLNLKPENYSNYYQELESLGYRVRNL